MVEEWSEKDLADLEFAKKHYKIGVKCYSVYQDGNYSTKLSEIGSSPYLYKSSNGVWIIASANLRHPNGNWAKLEHPINKIHELWI